MSQRAIDHLFHQQKSAGLETEKHVWCAWGGPRTSRKLRDVGTSKVPILLVSICKVTRKDLMCGKRIYVANDEHRRHAHAKQALVTRTLSVPNSTPKGAISSFNPGTLLPPVHDDTPKGHLLTTATTFSDKNHAPVAASKCRSVFVS